MRPSRVRWMKWEDGMRRFMAEDLCSSWTAAAQDKTVWNERAEDFAIWLAAEKELDCFKILRVEVFCPLWAF